jgi:phosphoribosylformimino-5-aminoimidazole carboxamide ribotide isomerase
MTGPNIGLYKKLKSKFPDLKIIASGGVSSLDDLKELKYLNIHGVIIGKAIYEGKIKLEELKTI